MMADRSLLASAITRGRPPRASLNSSMTVGASRPRGDGGKKQGRGQDPQCAEKRGGGRHENDRGRGECNTMITFTFILAFKLKPAAIPAGSRRAPDHEFRQQTDGDGRARRLDDALEQ